MRRVTSLPDHLSSGALVVDFDGVQVDLNSLDGGGGDGPVPEHNHDDRYYRESEVDDKLAAKADSTHSHSASQTTSGTFAEARIPTLPVSKVSGLQSALDGKASSSHSHSWAQVTGKPSSFTPSAHTHTWDDITGLPPSTDPGEHSHDISDVNGLQTALDGKASSSHTHSWAQVTGQPSTFPPSEHSHSWAQITGKPLTFSPADHAHGISDVSGLQAALNGKAASSHTHSVSEVSGVLPVSKGGTGIGYATAGTFLRGTGAGGFVLGDAAETRAALQVPHTGHTHTWSDISGKPTSFPPESHTHSLASSEVSGVLPVSKGGTGINYATAGTFLRGTGSGGFVLEDANTTRAALKVASENHTHTASHINSGVLDAARIPSLAISKITSLQSELDDKNARLEVLEFREDYWEVPLINGWEGSIRLKRVGSTVWGKTEALVNSSASGASVVFYLPGGYRPEENSERGILHQASSGDVILRRWAAGNSFIITGGGSSSAMYGSFSWDTNDPLPS